MNSGTTAERVYNTLKSRILDRKFRPGDRLDPSALGESLTSSVTPVRDALHVLSGEGLVETRPNDGFHLPRIDPIGLQDLYGWNAAVLGLAIQAWKPSVSGSWLLSVNDPIGGAAEATATAALFTAICWRSRNAEHRRAIASANDRLHAVRHAESQIVDDIAEELAGLQKVLVQGTAGHVRRKIAVYHQRRQRAAAEIVRILYRNGDAD